MRFARLPRRITGFHEGRAPRSRVEPAAFKRACYGVAAMDGGTVALLGEEERSRNYHAARIETRTESLTVLCNSVYPLVAFLAGDLGRIVHRGPRASAFVSPTSMASHFDALTGFRTLDADWLMEGVTADLLADLADAELRPIAYHEPERIGAVVFNEWD